MIHLTPDLYITKGAQRVLCQHPHDEKLCIKILLYPDQGRKEAHRERSYYEYLKKKSVSWDMLPYMHGEISTNLGPGTVFDLIRDHDGSVSQTLADYLTTPEKTHQHLQGLAASLADLANYLHSQRIVTKDIKQRNILYQKRTPTLGRMFLVDDIGDTDFIPLSKYIDFWAARKIRRKWNRFESHLLKSYAYNPWTVPLLRVVRHNLDHGGSIPAHIKDSNFL